MKLIALRDFSRVPALEDVEIEGALHKRHIHMGATFTIGKSDKLEDLSKQDQLLVSQLMVSGAVGDAADTKVVAGVKAEIALINRREENAKKAELAASTSSLAAQLTALTAKAAGK